MRVEIGQNQQISVHAWGAPGPEPAVMFFHGSGPGAGGFSNFQGNGPALAARGLYALAPDLLGYGTSSKPTDVNYSLANHADAMVRLLDALQIETVSLVGNSMGGAVAMRLALDHPERVARLLLMAPGGLEEKERYMEMRGIRSMLRCIYGPEGITLFGMQKVFSLQLHDPTGIPPGLIEARLEVALSQPIEVFKTMAIPNLSAEIDRIRCPVLALWGEEDQFCPVSGAETIRKALPAAEVITFPACGHWVMVEEEARFNQLAADFLAPG